MKITFGDLNYDLDLEEDKKYRKMDFGIEISKKSAKCKLCKKKIFSKRKRFFISYTDGTWEKRNYYHLNCILDSIKKDVNKKDLDLEKQEMVIEEL